MAVNEASWADSALPRDIARAVRSPKTLPQLSAELQITDARILWYLQKLKASGLVAEQGDSWTTTPDGVAFAAADTPTTQDCTVIPGRTVYDFQQAFADAAAGMFGPTFIQQSGQHGTRLSTERAAEFTNRLKDLIKEYFGAGHADRDATKYGFYWVITPTDLHPLDEQGNPG